MGPSFYHDWSLAPCLILYDIWKRNTAYHYGDFWKQNHAFGDLGCTYLHSSVIWPFETKSVIMPEWNIFCKKSSLYNFRTFSSLQGKKKNQTHYQSYFISPHPTPWKPQVLSDVIDLPTWTFHINGTMQYVLFVSDFFHLVLWFQDSSVEHVSVLLFLYSLLFVSNIPLYD